ncbi:MAG: sodium:solute symporter family protein [Verrucomicrobia bacterium]|nr:sodium:solute symporter family protein [Verrucomicrobiota bacterium]
MTIGSLHLIDILVVAGYLVVVTYLGHRAAKGNTNEDDFFLAGRKLGKLYQFFLNFGNATDANGAVSTASLVYQQGVSGVWLSLQTLFMNPYYWFMNLWFRRVRLVTVADLFEERLGSRALARFYAIFQIAASVVVTIGFGNLVAYKISASLMVKPEATWTAAERQSVENYQEMKQLEKQAKAAPLPPGARTRLDALHDADARGELRSYVTVLEPWTFYLVYTLIVGVYIVLGGMAATALNEAFQGILIVAFSAILIPAGLSALGGWHALGEKVPAAMFELFGTASSQVTGWTVLAILFVSVVQIHGIIGNMSVSGSARNEFAARFGAVSGTYAKRIMIIMWAFAGLIAIALYQGANALSDPDAAWGTMARQLLGPGLLGLMMAGVLAANMSTVAAQTMAISGLFVRNVYRHLRPALTDREAVTAGRWAIVGALAVGIIAATNMTNVFSVVQLLLTVNVPFGAAVVLIFVWRRLTPGAVWTAVIVSAVVNIIAPFVVPLVPALRQHPALVELAAAGASGRREPVYFESVVRSRPEDLSSPLEGRGRFHLELYLLDRAGIDMAARSSSARFAARFLFDGLFPFVLLLLVSLRTRAPPPAHVDQFYGKMKTPVGATPGLEAAAMAETRRDPHRFDHVKLFPRSSWEFTKWDRVDTIGFVACCAVSGGILWAFALLLRAAAG